MRPRVVLALIALAATPAATAAAQQAPIQPWHALGESLAGIYGWPNALLHVSAVALTPPRVFAVDEPVQEYLQRDDPRADPFGEVGYIAGWTLPIALPLVFYGIGLIDDNSELATAGAAAIQAVFVQALSVSALKWLTDRAGPYPDGDPTVERWHGGLLRDSERADDFNFNPFDLSGGLRWPSGHAASSFALVSSLVAFYPDQPWLAIAGYPFALAVSAGVVEADYHWLSDVVAGALIGHVTGWVVGATFRRRFDQRARARVQGRAPDYAVTAVVVPTAAPFGVRAGGAF
jgi:membrane-associated phospholipid phosphatase